MYGKSFEVTDKILDKDFVLPIGKAKVERLGTDITLVSFSKMVGMCMKAAEALQEEGINCEVINLRTLRPIDRDTIINSVKKTHRCIAVEEGWPQSGIGAEISAIIMECKFLRLINLFFS
jgi:pyruvate dehydrogenase E1 component beta subunit